MLLSIGTFLYLASKISKHAFVLRYLTIIFFLISSSLSKNSLISDILFQSLIFILGLEFLKFSFMILLKRRGKFLDIFCLGFPPLDVTSLVISTP